MFFIFAAMSKLLLELRDSNPYLAPALYFSFLSASLFNSFSKVNKINAFLETPNLCAFFSNLVANSSETLKVKRLFLFVTIASHLSSK